ncbi:fimbrial protein [Pantoea coffeiphila]|uniref:Fimbrial protein n=1 Tax=Pantoea coffeiphila TaxID=1465635 RepID=A0A2S9I9Y0_9GAMM|nr:fimbrial protein [Pantoea coffeiphila]PRD14581.1 fimbrial protein [Pantoea coffeiphila]
MQKQQGRKNCSPLVQNEQPFHLVRLAVATATLAICILYHPAILAADNWEVDGAHGEIHVHGSLTESACRLATSSAWQDISMGNIGTAQLRHIGERGKAVRFEIKLEDCASSASRMSDSFTGNVTWSNRQPSVSISFKAPLDPDNPELIQVSGASGLALRLTDMLGRDVRVGGHATPLQLTPGNNQLVYIIAPERTRASLVAGNWWSLINVGLDYQ